MGKGIETRFEMKTAMEALREVTEIIDEGKAGATVLMPLEQAAFAFRIPLATFGRMGGRRQELGISVVDRRVEVKLYGGGSERREAYQFLYGVIQNSLLGTAEEFLANKEIPLTLKEEFPGIEEIVDGGAASEVDLRLLQLHLEALWQGLRNRTDLEKPKRVLTSVSY